MPTYVYKFLDTGETIEVQQAFTDDSLTEYLHPETGAVHPVKKVFQPVGVTFKGSGFFKTDNRSKTTASSAGSSDGGRESTGSSSESKTESASPKKESTSDTSSTKKDTKVAKTPAAASTD